jgi:hypothetical protein
MDLSKVDPKELKIGIEVEKEHTDDLEIAKSIALDHLAEIDDYYSRLIKMEQEASNKLSTTIPSKPEKK